MHGNNGFPLGTVGSTMQRHSLIWDEVKEQGKGSVFLWVHSTLLFHLWPWSVLIPGGMLKHKTDLVCGWNKGSLLPPARKAGLWHVSAEDQGEDGTAFSHPLPLSTEQLHKVGFYASDRETQERSPYCNSFRMNCKCWGHQLKREQYPGIIQDNLHPAITLYLSWMKNNPCIGMTSILAEEHKSVFVRHPLVTKKVSFKYLSWLSKQTTVMKGISKDNRISLQWQSTSQSSRNLGAEWNAARFPSWVSRNMKQILKIFHVWSNHLRFKIQGYCKSHF